MQIRTLFQFRLRTLLLVMAVTAFGAHWAVLPLNDHKREVAATKHLEEGGWRVGWQELPDSLSSFTRLYDEDTLLRVRDLRVHKGALTKETLELILSYKHLRTLNLNGTSLTDTQAQQLVANLPDLYILDCNDTSVGYETLLQLRRDNPNLCHLAHRRAVAELERMGVFPYAERQNERAQTLRVSGRRFRVRWPTFLRAIKYYGRPIRTIKMRNLSIDESMLLDSLRKVRPDFKLSLFFDPPAQERGVISQAEFARITDRVCQLSLSGVEFAEAFPLPEESITVSNLQDVGPNVLAAFAKTPIQMLAINRSEATAYDSYVVPSTVEYLFLNECKPAAIDVSHCTRLKSIRLDGPWQTEHLQKLLEVPTLNIVHLNASAPVSPDLPSKFQQKGVTLHLRREWLPTTR